MEEVMRGWWSNCVLNSNAPASDWLLYLIHFFVPFFRPSTGTASLDPPLPCRGDGEEVAEGG